MRAPRHRPIAPAIPGMARTQAPAGIWYSAVLAPMVILASALAPGPTSAQHVANGYVPDQCVEPFTQGPVGSAGHKSATNLRQIGNISIIELAGDYARGNSAPRTQVARMLLSEHADAYDFIVAFTTFEFPTGDALAFYNPIRNDVSGIGQSRFDHSEAFGSAGRLQGYVDMAALGRYSLEPTSAAFETPLAMLAHEIMHRWGVFANYSLDGDPGSGLLGPDGSHWSALADTDASVMYGARWDETSPGTFRAIDVRRRYSFWDLYLAGMADAGELPPMRLIRGSPLPSTAIPTVGTETSGTLHLISPDQVIESLGPRAPDASRAQRHFQAAIVLLTRPGENVSPFTMMQLERFRTAFESYFQSITLGRATISLGSQARYAGAPVRAPPPLQGSPGPPPEHPLQAALAWLKDQQREDGRWEDRPGSAIRDTAVAVAAISQIEPGYPGLLLARNFLDARSARNADQANWRVRARSAPDPTDLELLRPGSSGGLAIRPGWRPALVDSINLLHLQSERNLLAPDSIDALEEFVAGAQSPSGAFSIVSGGPASVRATAFGAMGLQRSPHPDRRQDAARARDWLTQVIGPSAIGATPGETAELLMHAGALDLGSFMRDNLRIAVLARQGAAGDWSGGVYATALRALAVALQEQPNYVLSDARALPSNPRVGQPVDLRVRVRNSGGQPSPETPLRWYRDAGPEEGGTLIAPEFTVPALLPGESFDSLVGAEASALVGAQRIVARIDPDDLVIEANEADNEATASVGVMAGHAGPDAALFARDQRIEPERFQSLGETIEVVGRVRNLGATHADGLVVRLSRLFEDQRDPLAQTTIDLPAGGSSDFRLSFETATVEHHRLLLQVDPDGSIAEADESNNEVMLDLAVGSSTDLALLDGSLRVVPERPVLGDDVRIDLAVRNLGTTASGATRIVLETQEGEDWQTLRSLPLDLPAGATTTRSFAWRPSRVGLHAMRVVVDPDRIVPDSNPDNNGMTFSIEVDEDDSVNLTVVPDSVVLDPADPLQGGALNVAARLSNLGRVDAGAFTAGLYLGDPRDAGVRLSVQRLEPGLAAQTDTAVTFQVEDFPAHGDVALFVFVDSEFEVEERNEEDNLAIASTRSLKLPDLAVTPGSMVLSPSAPVLGAPVTLAVEVFNLGEQSSPVASVALFERSGQQRLEVTPASALPAIAPGRSATVEWSWILGESGPVEALSVIVDEIGTVREFDEGNNEASVLVAAQSGDAFVSQPFFSPNGDGVRDTTTAYFAAVEEEVSTILVRSPADRVIADLTHLMLRTGQLTSVTWDGRDRHGRRAPDGRYRVVALNASGYAHSEVDVELDTDRPAALDAVGTPRALTRTLPRSANPWLRSPEGGEAEEYLFALGSDANALPQLKRGVLRTHLLAGGLESALSVRWLDRHAQANALTRADIEDLALSEGDGSLLIILREHPSEAPARRSIWRQAPLAVDAPERIADLPPEADFARILGTFDGDHALLGDEGSGGDRWIVDLTTGGVSPLRSRSIDEQVLRIYRDGVVLGLSEGSRMLPSTFVPLSDASPLVEIHLAIDLHSPACLMRVQFHPDAPRMLLHAQSGETEFVDLVELRQGTSRRLVEVQRPLVDCVPATGSTKTVGAAGPQKGSIAGSQAIAALRAFWLERLGQPWVVHHLDREITQFSPDGAVIAVIPFTGPVRQGAYAAFGGFTNPSAHIGELIGRAFLCPEPVLPDWSDLAGRSAFERSSFDRSTESLYLIHGEVVGGGDAYYGEARYCEGANEYLRVGLDGSISPEAGVSRWPLESAEDRARFPLPTVLTDVVPPPGHWPRFIHANGTMLQQDGRVRHVSGRRFSPWSNADKLIDAWPSETRLALSSADASGSMAAVFSTLDRLSALLRADGNGEAVRLSGLATDRNFERFRIDYAPAGSPEDWRVLVPDTREEVLFEDFLTWAAPAAGAYVFRLTVVDRAGNRAIRFATAEVQFGSPIGELLQSSRAISPNGDGEQDALRLTFTVLRPTDQRFTVIDQAARKVKEEVRIYGALEVGPQAWSWDGRDAAGQPVPEGQYRVELSSGFQLGVAVDITAPSLEASQSPSYPVLADYSLTHCVQDRIGTRTNPHVEIELQRRRRGAEQWTQWRTLERCVAAPGGAPRQGLTPADFFGFQYRIRARDNAGNGSLLQLPAPAPVFALVTAGRHTTREPHLWQEYAVDSGFSPSMPEHLYLPPGGGRPTPSLLFPEAAVPVLLAISNPVADQTVLIDLAELPGEPEDGRSLPPSTALEWRTIAEALPRPESPFLYTVDVGIVEHLNRQVALRARMRMPDGSEQTSNGFWFDVGGIGLSCMQSTGDFSMVVSLHTPHRDVRVEVPMPGAGPSPGGARLRLPVVDSFALERGRVAYRFRMPPFAMASRLVAASVTDAFHRTFGGGMIDVGLCGGSVPPDPAVKLSIAPEPSPSCTATPSGHVRAVVREDLPETSPPRQYRLELHHPGMATPIAVASGRLSERPAQGFVIPTGSLPAGEARIELSYEHAAGQWRSISEHFPVDRTPPAAFIRSPAGNERVCLDGTPRPVLGDVFTDTRLEYLLEAGSGSGAATAFRPLGCSYTRKPNVFDELQFCTDPLEQTLLAPQHPPFSGELGELVRHPDYDTPPTTLRLRAMDWSGAQTCALVTIDVDASARLEERAPPQPTIDGAAVPSRVVVSTLPDAEHHVARWFLRAREPLRVTGELYRAQADGGQWYLVGNPLRTVAQHEQIAGDFDVAWDATDSGLSDGGYGVVFRAEDDCGNVRTIERFLLLDGSPPDLTLLRPTPGEALRTASVEAVGSVVDAHLRSFQLELGQTALGPWTELTEGRAAVRQPRVLAQWPTQGRSGGFWFRLRGDDKLGNRSEIIVPFTLLERPVVLDGARVAPLLFSPNGDGILDTTSVHIDLRRAAALSVAIRKRNGPIVATLADATPHPIGTLRLVWDGLGGAVPAGDGEYDVLITARDSAHPETIDELSLSVTLDTRAPTFSAVEPAASAHVSCGSIVAFSVDDEHFEQYDATLADPQGALVAGISGNLPGRAELAALEEGEEGDYRLQLHALDHAGNRSELNHSFVFDCTSPETELRAPEHASVHPGGAHSEIDVVGTASDLNLRGHGLTLESLANPSPPVVIAEGSASIDGLLARWTADVPEGPYLLTLAAEDQAGNTSASEVELTIDRTPPVARIDAPSDGDRIGGRLRLVGTATDDHFVEYRVDIATPAEAQANAWSPIFASDQPVEAADLLDIELNQQGELRVRLVVRDSVGLESSAEIGVHLDNVPPPTPISLVASVEDRVNARLAWQGGDAPDLAGFNVYRNGIRIQARGPGPRSTIDPDVPDGVWRYTVSAVDQVGNESEPSNAASIRIDRTPPEASIQRPPPNARLRGVVDVWGTAHSDDDFASYDLHAVDLDSGTRTLLHASGSPVRNGLLHRWTTSGLAEGARIRLELAARDLSGNSTEASVSVLVDNQPPAAPTGLQAQSSGSHVQTHWDPNSEPDLLGYLLFRNGRLIGHASSLPEDLRPLSFPDNHYLDSDAPDGAITYSVYAIDQAGNVSAPSVPATVSRDAGPPHVSILRPSPGLTFDQAIEVLAESDETDIAQVEFLVRRSGDSSWIELGAPITQRPWRTTLDPADLEFGAYEITALATDVAGQTDPDPDVVDVIYRDLTAPAPPAAVTALADGHDVTVDWAASDAPDLAGYLVERRNPDGTWLRLSAALLTDLLIVDSDRELGMHAYRVTALDHSENASEPSAEATAFVFQPTIEPEPTTPTASTSAVIRGIGGQRAGTSEVTIASTEGVASFDRGPVAASSAFALAPVPIAPGANLLTLRVTDAQGNRSVPATSAVSAGHRPQPPEPLLGTVDGGEVRLSWASSPDPQVAGYRLYRNGAPLRSDVPIVDAAAYQNGEPVPEVLDGDPNTIWRSQAPSTSDVLGSSLTIELASPVLVGTINLRWQEAQTSARDFDIEGWHDGRWNPIESVRDHAGASRLLHWRDAYPTSKLRLRLLRAQSRSGQSALAEVELMTRVLTATAESTDAPLDGRHVYTVSAVHVLGFEGEHSDGWTAEIGDAMPPPPVTLEGRVDERHAELTWSASNAADLSHYRLFRDGAPIAEVPSGQPRSHRDGPLANGVHRYSVSAIDAAGNASEPSNEVALTVTGSGPPTPRILSVTAQQGEPALHIEWTVSGEGSPVVAYRLESGFASTGLPSEYRELTRTGLSRYMHRGLLYGDRVYYRVRAEDAFGNLGEFSEPALGIVADLEPLSAPGLSWPTLPQRPLDWSRAVADVCGASDPGTTVRFSLDGTPIAQTALATTLGGSREIAVAEGYLDAILSPDGLQMFVSRLHNGTSHPAEGAGSSQVVSALQGGWRDLGFSRSGERLYGVDWWGNLRYWDVGHAESGSLWIGIEQIARAGVHPDGRHVLAVGRRSGQLGLWLFDRLGSSTTALPVPSPERIQHLRWSPTGEHAIAQHADGRIYRIETSTPSAMLLIEDVALRGSARPSPATDDVIFLDQVGSTSRLWATRPEAGPRLIAQWSEPAFDSTWSPDGSRIAVLLPDRVEILSSTDGRVLETIALASTTPTDSSRLEWSASWRILLRTPDSAVAPVLVDPSGRFCLRALALGAPGVRLIDAVAENAAGLRSHRSQPISLNYGPPSAAPLPDPSVAAEDIRFLPGAGEPGRGYAAIVTVRNRGQAPVAALQGRATLFLPDGASIPLPTFSALGAFEAGQVRAYALDLGILEQAGTHQLYVEIDPANALVEADEFNNAAMASMRLDAAGSAALTLSANALVAAPGEAFAGSITVAGATGFRGRVVLRVTTPEGTPQSLLLDQIVGPLAFAAPWQSVWSWRPDGAALAADYVLEARLSTLAGDLVDIRRLPLRVESFSELRLVLLPSRPSAVIGEPLPVQFGLDYPAGNQLLANGQLRLLAIDADGVHHDVWNGPAGSLLPGYTVRRSSVWATNGSAPGIARLRLTYVDDAIQRSIDREIELTVAPPVTRLAGSLAVLPSLPIALGSTASRISYRVENIGATPLANVELRVVVRPESGGPEMLQWLQQTDLPVAEPRTAEHALPALPPVPQSFVALLEARSGDTAWLRLAHLAFSSADLLPPEISVVTPSRSPIRTPSVVVADIVDRHSPVTSARFRIAPNDWLPLGAQGHRHEAILTLLPDGPHSVQVEATDAWGNRAQTTEVHFVVDNTPPRIIIGGVVDGQVGNVPVSPAITVQDAHPDQLSVWLDDAPLPTGSIVASEGEHRLGVQAIDAAGNRSDATIRFTLDLTPPALEIVDPPDGSIVYASSIDVRLASEPGSVVTLHAAGWQGSATVPHSGFATVSAVPLIEGPNHLWATASDPAGNVSAPASITITRRVKGGELTGSIVASLAQQPRGTTLTATVRIANGTAAPIADLSASVQVLSAQGPLAEWLDAVAVDAGGDLTRTVEFDSSAWPLGPVVLLLSIRQAGEWQSLDSTSVEIIDRQAPSVSLLSPVPQSVHRSPVDIEAIASDDDEVGRVEFRIDGQAWLALSPAGTGSWRGTVALADGGHTIEVRAQDRSGNSNDSPGVAFTVDNEPPQIAVSGVSDGGIYGEPVTPVIDVVDANLVSSSIRLNGSPYASGTPIQHSGVHRLDVEAEDAVGLRRELSITFEIDLEPSTVAIHSPVDGEVIAFPATAVSGSSRPFARVTVASPASTHVVDADATGDFIVEAVDLEEGLNRIVAVAVDRFGRISPEAAITVERSAAGDPRLTGTLKGTPLPVAVGKPMTVRHAVNETAGWARPELELRLRVLRAADQHEVATHAWVVALDAHGSTAGEHVFTTEAWSIGKHQVELQVRHDGRWIALVALAFDAVDRSPPGVAFVEPEADSYLAGPANVLIRAVDVLGSVARVEARVDGRPWVALQPAAESADLWRGLLPAPDDGPTVLQSRAVDDSGNVSEVDAIPVAFDATPPAIEVEGIEDGDLVNHPVTPRVRITDASPVQTTVVLNGMPFVSGTEISTHGPQTLHVHSVDAAGNASERRLQFELDLEPPQTVIVSPADGTVLRSASIDVIGRTEPAARVDFANGSYASAVVADATGAFLVPGVPLAPESNTLRARAIDSAGNEGEWASVTVVRRGQGVLRGAIVAPDRAIRGEPLQVRVDLDNDADESILVSPARVEAVLSNQGRVDLDVRVVALAERGSLSYAIDADTADWPTGHATLRLYATLDSEVLLGTASLVLTPEASAPTSPPPILIPNADRWWLLALVLLMLASVASRHSRSGARHD